jgi:Recombinase
MKTNKPSNLTLHEIMSLLDRTRPEDERVDEALPCSEHAIRVMSRILQEQGLTVVDADGLQHVVREAFLDGWCKISKYLEVYGGSALAQKVTGLSTRLERVEATLSTLTSESTDKSTGEAVSEAINAQTVEPEEAVALSETPSPPVALSTDTLTETPAPQTPAKLPLKRVAALSRRAKKLSAQGVSQKEIARRFNAEGIPTLSGIGQWHGSTVQHMIEKHGQEENP